VAEVDVPTRMMEFTEKGIWHGNVIDPDTKVVIACLVRAGVLPSEICLELLSQVLDPKNLRLDYLSMSRRVDDDGRVIGTDEAGLKIGGPIRDAILLIPDPMGATGGTVARTIELYQELDYGPARKEIALPMIATPEFMQRMRSECPGVTVYTGRLDRGLSTPEALAQPPGTVDGECGLTDNQYIVPGAGGVGEVLTNSWV
jgi:uracil phosphoribosyltransferase